MFGAVRIHGQQDLPGLVAQGRGIRTARLQRLARGWYLSLFLDAAPKPLTRAPGSEHLEAGLDLGYETLVAIVARDRGIVPLVANTGGTTGTTGTAPVAAISLSASNAGLAPCTGPIRDKVPHPRECQRIQRCLGQAQRGGRRTLAACIQQRSANARRHRNNAISRALVERYAVLYVSRDNLKSLQRLFGKSVLSAGHGLLISMMVAKGRQAGRRMVEVRSQNSTRRCSACGALTGPTGLQGLRVRIWSCGVCGTRHDRACNAAGNALQTGAGLAYGTVWPPGSGGVLPLETAGNG